MRVSTPVAVLACWDSSKQPFSRACNNDTGENYTSLPSIPAIFNRCLISPRFKAFPPWTGTEIRRFRDSLGWLVFMVFCCSVISFLMWRGMAWSRTGCQHSRMVMPSSLLSGLKWVRWMFRSSLMSNVVVSFAWSSTLVSSQRPACWTKQRTTC